MTLTDRFIKPGLRLFQCIASVRGARAREAPNAAHDALPVQMTQQEREALEAEEQRVEQPAPFVSLASVCAGLRAAHGFCRWSHWSPFTGGRR